MRNNARQTRAPRPRAAFRNGGFVLLEVLVSVVILSVSVAAIMRSFNLSLEAARRAEVFNTATMLAQSLVDEIQLSPPKEGNYKGGFGEENPHYSYKLTIDVGKVDYKEETRAREVKDFVPLRTYELEVFYQDKKGRDIRAHRIAGALMGVQRFSYEAMMEYQLFDLY